MSFSRMMLEDYSQNLRLRIIIIHVLIILMLVALSIRLYVLQVVKGDHFREIAENQVIRLIPIPAPRGKIFDRHGTLLVDSRAVYNILLSIKELRTDLKDISLPLAEGLNIDKQELEERFARAQERYWSESILVKADISSADMAWVDAHSLYFPELRIEPQLQRRYPANGVLAHVLGYVGEISLEQLEQPNYRNAGYKPGDIIGQEGLEAVYDSYLRGRDGYRKLVVDSRGRVHNVIETVDPQPGQDLVTTIDLNLQESAEEQLRNSPSKRGVIVAMDPNNGEIMAMASYPTFDPNLFSQRITSKEGRAEYAALMRDPKTPLYNRAIRGRYPPGSTWKVPMALAGLQQGAITVQRSNLLCGGGIKIGNKFTRCMGNHGTPDLLSAIMHSCDGYFYRLGLRMGLNGIMQMVDEFDLNKRTGVDLPHELVSWTPSREFKAQMNPHNPEWQDIDTVYASFGQVYDFTTPLAMLRAVAGIGAGGKLYVPHLLKNVRAIVEPSTDAYRPARTFSPLDPNQPNPKVIPIPKDQQNLVVRSMWSVVNSDGTASGLGIGGFDIAGKTGTAQVVSLGKDVGEYKDHAWFVSYAPADKPEISIIALIENAGFGAEHAAPAVRAVYDVYYAKTRFEEPPKP